MTVGNEIATFILCHSDVACPTLSGVYIGVFALDSSMSLQECIRNIICLQPKTYLSSFFLQQAVTQSKVLVQTTTVNMTWKAPIEGKKSVAFWYDTEQDIGTQYACLPLCWISESVVALSM